MNNIVPVVHCKYVLGYPPELHDDVVRVRLVDNLEILHTGLQDQIFLKQTD